VYDGFRWKAIGRIPDTERPYCEVVLEVAWKDAGNTPKLLVLTSCVPFQKIQALNGGTAQ